MLLSFFVLVKPYCGRVAPPHATEVAFLGLLRHRTRVDVVQDVYWSLQAGVIRRADGTLVMTVAPSSSVCVDGWFILGCHDCSCTPGVQPHPARVQSVWLRPGEAVNQPSTTHTLHISPTPNWGWGESPASPTPPPPPIPHPSRQKKKTHTGLWTGLPYLQKTRTLYRVSIPKQKINTTPPTTLPPHLPRVTRPPHPPPPSRRLEAGGGVLQ